MGGKAASPVAAGATGQELGTGAEWEYASAPESRDIVTIRPEYGLFVDGDFAAPRSGEHFATVNPASEEPLASVAQAGQEDVDLAVASARRAYDESWGTMPGRERAKYLYRIARVIQERAREFAVLESLDNGKPIKESRDVDIPLAAAHFFYHAGWADKLGYAGFGPSPRPVGVAGQVIPWNFPLLMAAWKLAPALATGNTCVLKPAETTPLSALLLAEVIREAGLPPGTVNIITGDGRTGRDLVAHPGVDKIAFTGSTEVGKEIQRAIAGTGKRLTLELGGKAANIVFDDAPIDQAVEGIVNGIFFNQGHVCCAGSRLLAQESIADTLLDRLKARLETLRLGDPLDKNTDIGAINSREQLDKITSLAAAGEAEGRPALVAGVPAARPRLLVPADRVQRGEPVAPDRARGDLRAGPVGAHVPHPGRGRGQGQQHPVRAVRRGLDGEGQPDPRHGTTVARGCGLGQHLQQVRPGQPVRRVPGIRVRAGGRPDRPGRVPPCLTNHGGARKSRRRKRPRLPQARRRRLRSSRPRALLRPPPRRIAPAPGRGAAPGLVPPEASQPAKPGEAAPASGAGPARPVTEPGPGWTCARPTSCSSGARSPALSPAARTRSPGRTARCWPTPRVPRARMPGTPWSPRGRRYPAGPARPPTTGARCFTGSRNCCRAGRHSSPRRERKE